MAAVVPLRGVNLLGEGEILLHLPVEQSVDLVAGILRLPSFLH